MKSVTHDSSESNNALCFGDLMQNICLATTIISQMPDFSDSSIVNPSADEDDMDNHLAAIYKPTIDMI